MTDVLDKIDASLEEVEEQLLSEFHRTLDAGAADGFVRLDAGVKGALTEVTDILHKELETSGSGGLSLVTDRHEVLYSRIAVLRHLFRTTLKMTQVVAAHDGIEQRRQALQRRVRHERSQQEPATPKSSGLRSLFSHRPTEQQQGRNEINVTAQEEQRLGQAQLYLDNGIFTASRELAMLASLSRGGTLDRPPEEAEGNDVPTPAGKAVFESRDLRYHAPPNERVQRPNAPQPKPQPEPEISKRDIAQTPEEIRRKLEARRDQTRAGPASFQSRELASSTYSEPPRPRRAEPAAEKPAVKSGPASFQSRELSSTSYSEPPRPRPSPFDRKEEPAKPSGKAVFGAKDIDPVAPSDPPRRREKKVDEDASEEEKRKGPATFEARDLSSPPFPKKD